MSQARSGTFRCLILGTLSDFQSPVRIADVQCTAKAGNHPRQPGGQLPGLWHAALDIHGTFMVHSWHSMACHHASPLPSTSCHKSGRVANGSQHPKCLEKEADVFQEPFVLARYCSTHSVSPVHPFLERPCSRLRQQRAQPCAR